MSEVAIVQEIDQDDGRQAIPALEMVGPRTTSRPKEKPKQQPSHSVVLHNDSIKRFGWVVAIVQKTFGYGPGKSFLITLRIHCLGRGIAWVGPLKVAEFKAQKLVGQGLDPLKAARGARPLKVTVEPTD